MRQHSPAQSPPGGYQAIELLVVLGILAILLSLMVPALNNGREAAREIACLNNLKQAGLAIANYQFNNQCFPMGFVARERLDPLKVNPGWGWQSAILPYMEQAAIYRTIDHREDASSPLFGSIWATRLNAYHCPSDRADSLYAIKTEDGKTISVVGATSYAGNYGAGGDVANKPGSGNGFFVRNLALIPEDFPDGLGSTFAVGERGGKLTLTPWIGVIEGGICSINPAGPSRSRKIGRGAVQVLAHVGDKPLNSLDSDPDDFFGSHPDGAIFLMGDGSARVVRDTISPAILRAHATRNGAELIGKD